MDLSELDLASVAHLDGVKVTVGPARTEILVVEQMTNLVDVPGSGFRFYAVPVKVRGMGIFPVRVSAEVG